MKIYKNKYAFIISLLSHLIFGFFVFIKINFSNNEVRLGGVHSALSTYVYQETLKTSAVQQEKSFKQLSQINKATITNKNISINKNVIALKKSSPQLRHLEEQQTRLTPAVSSEGNGKPIPDIVALLHSAIQEHQHYPDSAFQMEREGTTVLVFTLYADGTVKNIHIASSSGTELLDQAAVAAVHDAMPFKGVNKFISNPQEYQIAVSFELT